MIIIIIIIIVTMLCSPGTVEYRETITIIKRVLEEHKSTMVFSKPDLDWCDLAVQVCIIPYMSLSHTFKYQCICRRTLTRSRHPLLLFSNS